MTILIYVNKTKQTKRIIKIILFIFRETNSNSEINISAKSIQKLLTETKEFLTMFKTKLLLHLFISMLSLLNIKNILCKYNEWIWIFLKILKHKTIKSDDKWCFYLCKSQEKITVYY